MYSIGSKTAVDFAGLFQFRFRRRLAASPLKRAGLATVSCNPRKSLKELDSLLRRIRFFATPCACVIYVPAVRSAHDCSFAAGGKRAAIIQR
jgi:hypothetical protein